VVRKGARLCKADALIHHTHFLVTVENTEAEMYSNIERPHPNCCQHLANTHHGARGSS
jgi:hypothetical protein